MARLGAAGLGLARLGMARQGMARSLMLLEDRIQQDWRELFPHDPFPGALCAARAMAGEVLRLRAKTRRPRNQQEMRSREEIEEAHNLLTGILLNPEAAAQTINADQWLLVTAAHQVLCWVLLHFYNTSFTDALASLRARVDALGIRLLNEGKHAVHQQQDVE